MDSVVDSVGEACAVVGFGLRPELVWPAEGSAAGESDCDAVSAVVDSDSELRKSGTTLQADVEVRTAKLAKMALARARLVRENGVTFILGIVPHFIADLGRNWGGILVLLWGNCCQSILGIDPAHEEGKQRARDVMPHCSDRTGNGCLG